MADSKDLTHALREIYKARNISGATEVGQTGLKVFGGMIQEDFLNALRWPMSVKVYREMSDNDPIIGSMLFAVEMLIRGVQWKVEPASESAEDVEIADFINTCIDDMEKPWCEVINDIISFLPFGYSLHEVVYKKRLGIKNPRISLRSKYNDAKWGWRKMPIRGQDSIERWVYDDNNELTAVEQSTSTGFRATIPYDRLLHFRTSSRKDNPEGKSVLRNAYRPWMMRKFIEELEGIGLERDLAGLPFLGVHVDYFDEDDPEKVALMDQVKKIGENVRINEQGCVVYPLAYDERGNPLFEFKLMNSSGSKQFDTNTIISRYNATIAQTLLADFILIGHRGVGSFALSSDKTRLFAVAIGAWLNNIAEVFNKKAIPDLLKVNGIFPDVYPKLTYTDIEKRDLDQISQYVERLTRTGSVLPDVELENHLREMGDLPKRSVNSEVLPTVQFADNNFEEPESDPTARAEDQEDSE